jgi:hypothetical protein
LAVPRLAGATPTVVEEERDALALNLLGKAPESVDVERLAVACLAGRGDGHPDAHQPVVAGLGLADRDGVGVGLVDLPLLYVLVCAHVLSEYVRVRRGLVLGPRWRHRFGYSYNSSVRMLA